ncbi:hypothetical protein VH569_33730 [Azospirillum sp. 11R-A]|uniref:hypothetical protein n=1 Tax=Azospirillum sp. 11R-A TaxID=3111634 RepID=UPI003C165C80
MAKGKIDSAPQASRPTEGFDKLVTATVPMIRDLTPGPPDPQDFTEILARLAAAEGAVPPVYEDAVRFPFEAFVHNLGPDGFAALLSQDPDRRGIARCFFDVLHAILQNAEGYELQGTGAFQETVSDLYDGFLGAEDRRGVAPPDRAVVAPLVKWGEPAFGPYTWPVEVTAHFGVGCTIVSLPPAYARRGVLAWSTLGHETGGHDILGADTGLISEVAGAIETALAGPGTPTHATRHKPVIVDAWLNWANETASDVLGVLNMGFAAALGVLGYLRAASEAYGAAGGRTTGDLVIEGSAAAPHPIDALRAYVAAQTLRHCLYSGAKEDADFVDRLADQSLKGRTLSVDGCPWSVDEARKSAQEVADAIARTRFDALERHALASIQNWRDRDERIVTRIMALLKDGEIDDAGAAGLNREAFGTHAVAAAVLHAVGTGEDAPAFAGMRSILAAMHQANPVWGPLPIAVRGDIAPHPLIPGAALLHKDSGWLVRGPFGKAVIRPAMAAPPTLPWRRPYGDEGPWGHGGLKGGRWEYGAPRGGRWESGGLKGGPWEYGAPRGGRWESGGLKGGRWEYGAPRGGRWESGGLKGGRYD